MPSPHDVRRTATPIFSLALIVIGVAIVVRTIAEGGGPFTVGVLLGLLFAAAGAGRLWVARRLP
jgi:drug/metabolite transporter (DMT)-like permease